MMVTSDHTSPNIPASADVRSEVVRQEDSVMSTADPKKALPSVHGPNGVNGSSSSVCNDVNSCSYGNVNVTSKLHAKSAGFCDLTLPIFSDSTKQVPLHFIRVLQS